MLVARIWPNKSTGASGFRPNSRLCCLKKKHSYSASLLLLGYYLPCGWSSKNPDDTHGKKNVEIVICVDKE
jgi:hypothetical protein